MRTAASPASTEGRRGVREVVSGYDEQGYIAMDTGRGEARQLFAQGKVAFYDDAVVAKGPGRQQRRGPRRGRQRLLGHGPPRPEGRRQTQSTMWGHMLVTFKNSEYQEQAAELAKTLSERRGGPGLLQEQRHAPVTKSAAELDEGEERRIPERASSPPPPPPAWRDRPHGQRQRVKSVITEELQYALLGQKTAEQAVSDMAARLGGPVKPICYPQQPEQAQPRSY